MELLVVLAVITLLTALILPAVEQARAAAKTVACASNMRQVAIAALMYAGECKGAFPPNVSGANGGTFWHDLGILGRYLPAARRDDPRGVTGPVVTCPQDVDAIRSVAMNVWASSRTDRPIETSGRGTMWRVNVSQPAKMILFAEAWSWVGSATAGYNSPSVVGSFGSFPGYRFGGGGGLAPRKYFGRFGYVNCEIDYSRHRLRRGPGVRTEPRGRANFAYADGHVELKSNDQLANYRTGRSTFDSFWSPSDYAQDAKLD